MDARRKTDRCGDVQSPINLFLKLHKGYNDYTYTVLCTQDFNSKSGNEGSRAGGAPGKHTRNALTAENII